MTNIAYQPNYHFINGGKQLYFEMPEYTRYPARTAKQETPFLPVEQNL